MNAAFDATGNILVAGIRVAKRGTQVPGMSCLQHDTDAQNEIGPAIEFPYIFIPALKETTDQHRLPLLDSGSICRSAGSSACDPVRTLAGQCGRPVRNVR